MGNLVSATSYADTLVNTLNWKQPMKIQQAKLLVLLTKLNVRMEAPFTIADGDAIMDLDSMCVYIFISGQFIQFSSAI